MLPLVAQLEHMQEIVTAGLKSQVVKMAGEFELEVIAMGMVSGQLQIQLPVSLDTECTIWDTPECLVIETIFLHTVLVFDFQPLGENPLYQLTGMSVCVYADGYGPLWNLIQEELATEELLV